MARAAPRPTLLYLMKQVELAVRARLDDMVRPDGLTALQYTALTVLADHPDLSSAQLARRSFVTAQSMADMVTTLSARGLIERRRDPADARRLALSLTRAGEHLLQTYRAPAAAIEAQMLRGLDRAEATALRTALEQCRTALDESAEAGRRATPASRRS
ncbi:MarR family winged helix-turn-helix transcriptional regulator [uncultured Jatrophihabitans sp.]|uniref:MarR family winged helix-turn-helix transcriptional regulator n=1 Tax=uncultured Jatrophihabitans sp. TaxID=1610747 RepID=UPI0035CBAEDA